MTARTLRVLLLETEPDSPVSMPLHELCGRNLLSRDPLLEALQLDSTSKTKYLT